MKSGTTVSKSSHFGAKDVIQKLEFKSVRTPGRPDLIPTDTEERRNSKCQLSSVKYYCRNNQHKTREMAARQILNRKV